MSEITDIRDQAAALLLTESCQTIAFRYKDCLINGREYRRVSEHLQADRLHIQLRSLSDVGDGAKAQYDDDSDTLFVQHNFLLIPQFRWLFDQPACVHELTHAVYDNQALGTQPALDSEIVAFIAEAFFSIRSGLPYPDQSNNIGRCARAIAVHMGTGGTLSESAATRLRNELLTHPIYLRQRDLRLRSSGIG